MVGLYKSYSGQLLSDGKDQSCRLRCMELWHILEYLTCTVSYEQTDFQV